MIFFRFKEEHTRATTNALVNMSSATESVGGAGASGAASSDRLYSWGGCGVRSFLEEARTNIGDVDVDLMFLWDIDDTYGSYIGITLLRWKEAVDKLRSGPASRDLARVVIANHMYIVLHAPISIRLEMMKIKYSTFTGLSGDKLDILRKELTDYNTTFCKRVKRSLQEINHRLADPSTFCTADDDDAPDTRCCTRCAREVLAALALKSIIVKDLCNDLKVSEGDTAWDLVHPVSLKNTMDEYEEEERAKKASGGAAAGGAGAH